MDEAGLAPRVHCSALVMSVRTITLVSSRACQVARRCTQARVVDGLDELAPLLRAAGGGATRLDLIGHSTRGHHYLRLGRDALDLLDPRIAASVTALGEPLGVAGVQHLRLLGCSTAVGPAARATMVRLAALTGCVVSGTVRPLLAAHYDASGFRNQFSRVLVDVRPVRSHHPRPENVHVPHPFRSFAPARAAVHAGP